MYQAFLFCRLSANSGLDGIEQNILARDDFSKEGFPKAPLPNLGEILIDFEYFFWVGLDL